MEPIAVVGISCTFAGGINTSELFWKVLKDSIDVGSEIPKERFDPDSYAPLYNTKKPLIRRGYFINNDELDHFDPSFFGVTDADAMSMDPCHRILLEKFVHLLEDANYPVDQMKGSRTAVYIGQFTTDHPTTFYRSKVEDQSNLLGPNISVYNASARLSYHFDLHGPNLTLDTACCSSLQALHLAVQSLRNGEADFAVAGGTNLNYAPESFFISLITGAISPDGRSRSYSEDANGYARGDGVAMVLLKRLSDAIRDKDKIYCVVRDVMASHDGNEEKMNYNVPSSFGQNLLLKEIYSRNNIDLNEVFYIEGHGTGTQVGDPIEANTLGKFFKRSPYNPPLLIGSVKSVIGHTEATAGIASLIKIALCMKYRMLTPNMNFTSLNPKIEAEKYNLHVVNHIINFPEQTVTVGINNFGMGGNTAHAIVSEWVEDHSYNSSIHIDEKLEQDFILTFSSKCDQSLKIHLEKISKWLSTIPKQFIENHEQLFLAYLSQKLLLKRTTNFSHRLSFVCSNFKQLEHQIQSYLADQTTTPGVVLPQDKLLIEHQSNSNICFIYSGQGPQWWAMGRQLYLTESIFRHWIDKLHLEFLSVSNHSFSLIKELIEPTKEEDSQINFTNIAQPLILSVQIALTSLWLSWGIRPQYIVGHSVGEVAAAYVAGRLTLNEAVQIIYHRSRVQNFNTNQGGKMLALFLSEDETNKLLINCQDRIQIAAISSPKSVTLSGDKDALENLYNNLSITQPNVYKTWLKIENAFHSKQMERFHIYEELIESLLHIKGNGYHQEFDQLCSNAILYSTVTGTRMNGTSLDGEYWWKNVRNPVLFNDAIQSILSDMTQSKGIPIFIEISAHPVLSATIPECFQQFSQSHSLLSNQTPIVLHSLKRKQNEQQTMLSSLCLLFSYFGSNLVHWKRFFNSRSYAQILSEKHSLSKSINSLLDTLPNYSFNHQIYWYESKDSVFARRAIKRKHHPLLGYRRWHHDTPMPAWRNIFTMNSNATNLSYLLDHNIQGATLFPAAAFIELIFSAINQLLQYVSTEQKSITIQNVQFLHGLELNPEVTIQLETVIIMPFKEFYVYSRRKQPNDSIRTSGISGNDITTKYGDEQFLHTYSSNEWTLHCRGLINLKVDASLISSMYDIDSILNRLLPSNNPKATIVAQTESELDKMYKYFSIADHKFGPRFRSIKALYRYQYEALLELMIPSALANEEYFNRDEYICHPAVLDACFQGLIPLIPGNFYELGIPISIDEITLFDRNKHLLSTQQQLYATQSVNTSVNGITTNKTYTTDMLVFSYSNQSSSSEPMVAFRGFKIQIREDRSVDKSIFQKIEESASVCSNNPKKIVPVNELIDHLCAYQYWNTTQLHTITSATNSDEQWIIFCDQKQHICLQIAEMLIKNQIKPENITLIYSSIDNEKTINQQSLFKEIIIDDISSISKLNELKSFEQNHSINIVFGWPLDLSSLNNNVSFPGEERFECSTLMHIVQIIYEIKFDKHPNIFILTANAQPLNNGQNSEKFDFLPSPVIGFAKSILNEYAINRMKLIDLQFSHLSENLLQIILNEMYSTIYSSSDTCQDEEVVLTSSNNNLIQRYIPEYSIIDSSKDRMKNDRQQRLIPKSNTDHIHFQLQVPKSRLISDLKWISNPTNSTDLASTEVEISVYCVGLNFRDIAKLRGLHPHTRGSEDQYDKNEFIGMGFSGVVLRKGSGVHLNINDRVFGMVTNQNAFQSHLVVNENHLVQAPSDLTMVQLSTLPTYITAFYSLQDCLKLKSSQTILIHSAASATGLAFIQYAKMIGANIIATAGTKEKRDFLREKYQLEHVFNNKDLSFVRQIRQIYPNGIDIIVNSLSGLFRNESLKLLAPFGHFIELNQNDIYANSNLSLFPLRTNCTYHVIDLTSLQKYSPEKIQCLLKDIANLCNMKHLTPITPVLEFDASQIQEAFSVYSQARHVGKFVIKIAQSDRELLIENDPTEKQTSHKHMFSKSVCNEGTIVISGGLGGLGIDISKWMIRERGVKRIVLLSRRDIDQLEKTSYQYKDWSHLQEIAKENHAFVEVMKADIRDYDQVFNALCHISEMKSYPIRGIIHSAMVLHDSLFQNLTNEILHKVMQPKIHGAWNLHRATETLSCPLEFFIMFSSIRNHITGVGQSNYNAGNNFLDSLAYWRLNYRNLPAISIALPAISGAGYLHNHAQSTVELMEQQGVHLMPSKYVFQVIEQLQHNQKEQQRTLGKTNLFNPIIFSVDWKTLLTTNLPIKFNNFVKQFSKTNPEETKISSDDNNKPSNFDLDTITNKIRLRISKLFGALNSNRIDLVKPLIHQGMDSLTAVELRTWLVREMSVNIPLVELLQGMSINNLALYIQQKALQHQTNMNINKNSSELSSKDINNNENSLVNAESEKHHEEFENSYNGTSLLLPLHYPGNRSTLFCVHDIIGLSQTFIQFAIQMTNSYHNECPSIFAFRASGYQTKESFLQSIETMAEQYIFQMKRIQPTGPYYLLGYSFGGLVAYEMARQLYEKHQTTVESLILIDPPIPIEHPLILPKQIKENLFWSLKTLQFIFNYFAKDETSNLLLNQLFSSSQSSIEEQVQMLIQQALLILKTRFPFLKDNEEMFEIIKANMIAKESYTYHTARTSNDLIKINHTIMFTLKDNPSNKTKRQIWKSLLPHLIIEDVAGTHQTLLENPTVQFIVDRSKQMFTY
ncbi:unnamed protein product [Adineta steineri]|uniref:Polyketide synthase n=1 Tax=Adineta steineri TaxID=433720 RepID=A0A814ZPC4_9BILA|nr:unnamed protein product [Adineta steineri]CAF1395229.1 unnamed protein product [Adineta steineri]